MSGKLPQMPSLAQLGLSNQERSSQPKNMASDGTKKVSYRATRPRNTRPFQSRAGSSTTATTYPEMKITPHAQVIAQYILQYPIFAVDAPTGTGKTRYLPYTMASRGYKVRVSIPTTVAVRDAYKFQRDHSKLRVGYAAGREVHYSTTDQLVYATTGHFTRSILSIVQNGRNVDAEVRKVLGDILFIDEVHTSTSEITLLIGLVRHLFGTKGPRIVFSSATFNHGDIMDHFKDFPIYKVSLEAKPVEVYYLPANTKYNPLKDDPNSLILDYVRQELQRWQQSGAKPYHGIVFRPGVFEVEDTIEKLVNAFPDNAPIDFYPAYSNLSPEELNQIFVTTDHMKIIVGTPIIESSVTVEDVGFVIDDMLVKIAETSSTGGNKLSLALVSQAASAQRKGRTGRTMPGRNYKLITAKQFENLEPYRTREIDRVPIYDIILQLIDAQLSPREILKISIARYDQARRVLINLGMVENTGDRYTVTSIGRFVSNIPLSIHNAYMIYLGYQRFLDAVRSRSDISAERILLRSTIAVACMIEAYGPSYFYVPRKGRQESQAEYQARKDAHIDKFHQKFRGLTDIHTFANIFWEMMHEIDLARQYDTRTRYKFMNYVLEWSKNNQMNHKKIKEFLSVMRDVESIVESMITREKSLRSSSVESGQAQVLPRGMLGKHGFSIGRDLPEGGYITLGNVVAPIFAKAYAVNKFTQVRDRNGNIAYLDARTGIQYKINQRTSFNEVVVTKKTGPQTIIAAQTVEVVGNRGTLYLAGIFVPEEYIGSAFAASAPVTASNSRVQNRVNNFKALWEQVPADQRQVQEYADIGSGAGDISLGIGQYLGLERSQIHLLDIESAPDVELITNNTIPLSNASMNLITALVSIHHFEDPERMLQEIHRITSPEGYLYLREHDVTDLSQINYINWIHLLDMVNRGQNEVNTYYAGYFSWNNLRQYLEASGYTVVGYRPFPEPNPQHLYNALFKLTGTPSSTVPALNPQIVSLTNSVQAYNTHAALRGKVQRTARNKYGLNLNSTRRFTSPDDAFNYLTQLKL